MVRPRGRTSKGRQRIEIAFKEDHDSRQVTFSKRRAGLFKKASELSTLCGASVAVVTFSRAGNAFAFGHPSVDAVLHRYVGADDAEGDHAGGEGDDAGELQTLRRAAEETKADAAAEQSRLRDVADKIAQAKGDAQPWWEADVQALGEAELAEFARALERLRGNIRRRVETMLAAQPPPPPPPQQQQQQQ